MLACASMGAEKSLFFPHEASTELKVSIQENILLFSYLTDAQADLYLHISENPEGIFSHDETYTLFSGLNSIVIQSSLGL